MTFKHNFGQTKKTAGSRATAICFIIFGLLFGVGMLVREYRIVKTPSAISPTYPATPSAPPVISESLRRVDETCASLPQPEKFEFVSKTAPTETDRFATIAYTYRSSRAAAEIYPSFIVWFTQNGWTDNKTIYERLEYSKGRQTVWLAPYHMKEAGDFFTVSCTEWKEVGDAE